MSRDEGDERHGLVLALAGLPVLFLLLPLGYGWRYRGRVDHRAVRWGEPVIAVAGLGVSCAILAGTFVVSLGVLDALSDPADGVPPVGGGEPTGIGGPPWTLASSQEHREEAALRRDQSLLPARRRAENRDWASATKSSTRRVVVLLGSSALHCAYNGRLMG